MSRAAERDRYRAAMLERLEQMEERQMEATAVDQAAVTLFTEIAVRFRHAQAAFPGMTWEEFNDLSRRRHRGSKRGRSVQSLEERNDTPIARAARDVDRLKTLWTDYAAGGTGAPPISHLEIAAERHGVTEEEVGERIRRPKSRNPHRLATES